MVWIAQILVAKVASRMGMLAMVKTRVVLLTKVVDWVVRLRLKLSPNNNTISPSDCILFHRLVWVERVTIKEGTTKEGDFCKSIQRTRVLSNKMFKC